MNVSILPTVNACLNGISIILLILGFIQIKKKNSRLHKRFMLSALCTSALFLISYLIYHYSAGSVPYSYHDWTRPVYFIILISHIILAAVMVPFILAAVYHALRENYTAHKRLTRPLWPVWIFVSVSGLAVYVMLYHL